MSKIDQFFYENGTPKHIILYNGEFIDGVAEYFRKISREFVLRLRLPNDGPTEQNIIKSLRKLVMGGV